MLKMTRELAKRLMMLNPLIKLLDMIAVLSSRTSSSIVMYRIAL